MILTLLSELAMSTATHVVTAEQLIRIPCGSNRYELVKGELLTMSPSGAEHGAVTANLTAPLTTYVKANKMGVVFGAETGFKLESNPDTVLAPDISFIRTDRIKGLCEGYLEIAPDLAVEVISPGESKREVENKAAQWLAFGTVMVCLIYPKLRTVDVRRVTGERFLLSEADELTGEGVVHGFRIPVSEIFTGLSR
jgi:Uma2 family endonuclease